MSLAVDLSELYLSCERGLELLREDPLAAFRCTSEVQRDFLRGLSFADEIYLHSGNGFGKTTIGAFAGVAFARGETHLDGIALPRLASPNVGLVISIDYEQQKLSVQKAYLRAVGSWPHKAEWAGEVLKSLRVKPNGCESDNPRDWSLIQFMSAKNAASGTGARADWVHADEPPPPAIWREIRKAGLGLRIFPHFITATPLRRSHWWWLRADYPLDYEGRLHNGFLRLRGSTYDNEALLPEDIARIERQFANLPPDEKRARLYGHEMDTEGASPFRANMAELQRWLDAAYPGEAREWKIAREVMTATGKQLVTQVVSVEFWDDPVTGHRYRDVADPSLGIDDGDHDPGESTMWDMDARHDVASYSGYIGEYGLGVLSAGLCRHYSDALLDPEVGGGYGSAFLSGVRAAKYGRLVNDATGRQELDRTRIGFTISADTRKEFAAALNEALVASAQGHPWLTIRNPRIIADLMDLVVDEKDRPVTDAGRHDEGFITAGRIATLLAPDRTRVVVPMRQKVESIRDRGMKRYRESIGQPEQNGKQRVRPRFRMPSR